MPAHSDAILRPEQARYLEVLLPPRPAALAELERRGRAAGESIPDPQTLRLVAVLARARDPRRILQVGGGGYASVGLALAAPLAQVDVVDGDHARLERIGAEADEAGVGDRVRRIHAPPLEAITARDLPFDLIFAHGCEPDYRRLLDRSLPRLVVGGLLLFDNLLAGGRVAEPDDREEDPRADAVEAFNGYFMIHPQLSASIVPVAGGLGVGVKTKPVVMEMGGPF